MKGGVGFLGTNRREDQRRPSLPGQDWFRITGVSEDIRDLRTEQIEIVKDVQRAWLNANSGYLRLELARAQSPASSVCDYVDSPRMGLVLRSRKNVRLVIGFRDRQRRRAQGIRRRFLRNYEQDSGPGRHLAASSIPAERCASQHFLTIFPFIWACLHAASQDSRMSPMGSPL